MIRTTAICALALLTACSSAQQQDSSFFKEAGAVIDTGQFGNATMNNTMVMTGEGGYVSSLASRFSSEVTSMVNFDFNSAQLDDNARAVLRQQATWIRQFPEVRFRVYGHTDAVGGDAYNRALGLRRANAVVNYLISQGISRARLEAVVSYGKTQPLVVTDGRERRNRRTVTEVSGFVRGHPTLLNGKYAEVIHREYIESAKPPTTLQGITGSDVETGN